MISWVVLLDLVHCSIGANKSGFGIGDTSGVAEAIKLDPIAIAGKGRFAECSSMGGC